MRPMAKDYTGDMLGLELMLEISMKGAAPIQAHEALMTLSQSRMHPEPPKRSVLAKKFLHLLAGRSLP